MKDDLEHYRVFSRLTGLAYFQVVSGKKWMIVGGMCLPAYLGVTLFLYVMTGGGVYKETLLKNLDFDLLEQNNPGDTKIQNLRKAVPWRAVDELYERMRAIMNEWRPEDFDAVVSEHRAAFHSNLSLGG